LPERHSQQDSTGPDWPVALAPMAGITDLPFRALALRFGASWVVSEMVASQDMVQARPSARAKAELGFDQPATAIQIAGREEHWMAEAARMAEAMGAAQIDINMGCPAKRVTNGLSGSALLRDPDHALRLIAAVTAAVAVPVTLKTRLGWDGAMLNAADVARRAVDAGVSRVVIHGRTRCQFYTGAADWAAIAPIRRAVAVAVIANGDITGAGAARAALAASGGAGVMIGRAARGQPWLLGQVRAALAGRPTPAAPQGADRAALVAEHYQAMLSFYGTDLGAVTARKHLGWYMAHAGTPGPLRHTILTALPAEVLRLLPDAFGEPVPSCVPDPMPDPMTDLMPDLMPVPMPAQVAA